MNSLRSDRGWSIVLLLQGARSSHRPSDRGPDQSLSFLCQVLEAEFAQLEVAIAPSTLQRRWPPIRITKRFRRAANTSAVGRGLRARLP